MAISNPFMRSPGCWLKYDTESHFPSALISESSQVDFSLLLHSIQTIPIEMTPLTSDVNPRATILNPALVVAVQGPALWPDEFACSPASSFSRPKDRPEALCRLARAEDATGNYDSNKVSLLQETFHHDSCLRSYMYDAEEATIVAHILYTEGGNRCSFVSCIVDLISFPPVTGSASSRTVVSGSTS